MTTAKNESAEQRARRLELRCGYNWKRRGPPKGPVTRKVLTTDERRTYMQRWRYGMTDEHWAQLLVAQGSSCGICRSAEPRGGKNWSVDHCHETGRVRGILCSVCNLALGHFDDDLERIQNALIYLQATPAIDVVVPNMSRLRDTGRRK